MCKLAVNAFESRLDGRWVCIKTASVPIPQPGFPCVKVEKGTTFTPQVVFAGHDDFTSYLEAVAVDEPDG